ncbi:Heme peroxidase [Mycena chlorophos]|uniref:Heme peroxidase n=1 Tax=Mycena chlorophos TaxID=658473 RepID=A0A8H6TP82_MYCCL|nr:Heme peroxidase [Mycena chlorophos]
MTTVPPVERVELAADTVAHWLHRKPPVAADGKYNVEDQPQPEDDPKDHSIVTRALEELERLKKDPMQASQIFGAPSALIDLVAHPESVDDRKGAFGLGLTALAELPSDSAPATKLADSMLSLLYTTIPHPPATSLGAQYSWRQADGGGNNILSPDIGRAGTPYARSVQSKRAIAPSTLPDAGLIFDTLMRARDIQNHPAGNSSLTFAWATIVTHSVFRTDPKDWNINQTSSYFDLSPLYGINQETQDLVRDKAQGRGLLYPDVFSEERLSFLPPAASAILVLFNRNHNYIAQKLLQINERGTWTDPPPQDAKARAKQDEDIFQIARLVNCGHFMSIIVGDYVAAFLGVSEGITSPLLNNAFSPIHDPEGEPLTRGQGNAVSVEFNILYRWHALLSEPDREYATQSLTSVFGTSKPLEDLTLSDFRAGFIRQLASVPADPRQRTFAGLTRAADGQFADADIARILQDATENPAGSFRARGVQKELRVIEMLGIEQSRRWGVCTMNEFRQFLGLKQFESFEEWNSDRSVANAARQLYGHVDNLELYVGLECEEIMPLSRGVRLSSGYTLMRAILSDAIALIRGDRYYTTDFTPWNLTSWGYEDCQRDLNNGGLGGQLPKLLARHLPLYYPSNSVFTTYPFFTPQHMKQSLTSQGIAAQYSFVRPKPDTEPVVISTMSGIRAVLGDEHAFKQIYGLKYLGSARKWATNALLAVHPATSLHSEFHSLLMEQIKISGWEYDGAPGHYIDLVRGVVNPAVVRWVANNLCGIEPKTSANPSGVFTEHELYEMFATIYTDVYLSIGDSEHGFANNSAASRARSVLSGLTSAAVVKVLPDIGENVLADAAALLSDLVHPSSIKSPFADFVRQLKKTKPEAKLNEMVGAILELALDSCANYAQAAVQVVDFYLGQGREAELARIKAIVHGPSQGPEADRTLYAYIREALRLSPQRYGIWRECVQDVVVPQGATAVPVQVKAGQRVFTSLANAYLNPTDFPNPTKVDLSRPVASYAHTPTPSPTSGSGSAHAVPVSLEQVWILETLKAVFALPNVRRAAGVAGQLAGFPDDAQPWAPETVVRVYLTPYGTTGAWPGSMNLVFDA